MNDFVDAGKTYADDDHSPEAALWRVTKGRAHEGAKISSADEFGNDSNPEPGDVQANVHALRAEVSKLHLLLAKFFSTYHRSEGFVNDDRSLNLDA